MHYSHLLSATFAALIVASPTPKDTTSELKRSPGFITLLDGSKLEVSPAHNKRDIQLTDGSWLKVSSSDDGKSLSKRGDDKISSCGPKSGWMPVADHGVHLDVAMWGYTSAVATFCSRAAWGLNPDGSATPVVVAAGTRISYTIRWENDKENVEDIYRGHRIGLKNSQPGHVEFEVNNKRDAGKQTNDYTMNEENCKTYLMKMADTTSDCYGSNNKDTKGGTWQKEDNKLTFHALPAADADKNKPHNELRI